MTRVTKNTTYVLTGISAGLFILLNWIFADDLFKLNSDVLFYQKGADGIKVISEGTIWTYVLLALIVAAGINQARSLGANVVNVESKVDETTPGQVHDPLTWRLLMGNVFFALLWLPLRFFVGREWLSAGEHKLRSSAWMDGGAALKGYWTNATTVPEGRPNSPAGTYDWFNRFLHYMLTHEWYTWFAKVIAVGEFLVGVGLVVGALVGIAAFFGTLMNFNFQLAGSASSNPVLFGLGVFLVLGWKVAGYWGLDRYLLRIVGTPWARGQAYQPKGATPTPGTLRASRS
jgi:thiosulfate dehydrogenase (quinone) large subunit